MGSGAAFIHDGDGTLYLYLIQNAGPESKSVNRLYQQRAGRHVQGRDAKARASDVAGYNMGVAVGDVNNDGRPDVLLTQYGGIRLFLNLGGGKFEDVDRRGRAEQSAAGPRPPPSSTTTATAGSISSSSIISITIPT